MTMLRLFDLFTESLIRHPLIFHIVLMKVAKGRKYLFTQIVFLFLSLR